MARVNCSPISSLISLGLSLQLWDPSASVVLYPGSYFLNQGKLGHSLFVSHPSMDSVSLMTSSVLCMQFLTLSLSSLCYIFASSSFCSFSYQS